MKKLFIMIAAAVLVIAGLWNQPVEAATYQIVAEGQYVMGDGDTREIAKDKAVKDAMRIAIEKAGVYVESCSKAQNYELTDDQVRMVAAGCIKVLDQSVDFYTEKNDWRAQAVIYAEVNTDNINLKEIMQKYSKQRDSQPAQQEPVPNDYNRPMASNARFTSVVFDCRKFTDANSYYDLSIDYFNVQDSNGTVLYSSYNLFPDLQKRLKDGETEMLATMADNENQFIGGERPYVITPTYVSKNLGSSPIHISYIIVSRQDAQILRQLNAKYQLLGKGLVNILV